LAAGGGESRPVTSPRWAPADGRAVTAAGSGHIRGLRIVADANAPMTSAIRITGADRRVELTEIEGPMAAGIDIADASGVTVNGSLVHTTQGPAVAIESASGVSLAGNTFVGTGSSPPTALLLKGGVRPTFTRNLFAG